MFKKNSSYLDNGFQHIYIYIFFFISSKLVYSSCGWPKVQLHHKNEKKNSKGPFTIGVTLPPSLKNRIYIFHYLPKIKITKN
jgi:hypothetical protein